MADKDFQHWAEDMMRILLEDIEESKKLTRETRALTIEARKQAEIAQKQAEAAQKQADSAWELATIAHLELKEFRKPWRSAAAVEKAVWYEWGINSNKT